MRSLNGKVQISQDAVSIQVVRRMGENSVMPAVFCKVHRSPCLSTGVFDSPALILNVNEKLDIAQETNPGTGYFSLRQKNSARALNIMKLSSLIVMLLF